MQLAIVLPAIAVVVAIAVFAFLCVTRRGLLSPPVGLVIRISSFLALKPPGLYDVGQRRKKDESDGLVAGLPPGKGISARDFGLPGPGGAIPARLYRPENARSDSLMIYYHAGGWALGSVNSNDSVARGLCRACAMPVLSIDYRLAPEHRFPAAFEDAMAAYRWALDASAEEGWAPSRIFVSGSSAGGGLAASVCLEARDSGISPPEGQILLYPVTDASRTDRASYGRYATGYLLTKADMEWFIGLYCPESSRKDPRVSPLLAEDHSRLPPALVLTAEFDVLRDEGEAYAAKLSLSGVPVKLRRMRGLVHAFASMGRFVPAAGKAFRLARDFCLSRR